MSETTPPMGQTTPPATQAKSPGSGIAPTENVAFGFGDEEEVLDLETARASLIAARADFAVELDRLEAAARSALDVRARASEHKGQVAAGVGGLAFLLLGGPKRVVRGARWLLSGRQERPKTLLPKDIGVLLDRLGDDGDTINRALEYDFAQYLKQAHPKPKGFIRSSLELSAQGALAGAVSRAMARLVDRALKAPGPAYQATLKDVRARPGSRPPGVPASGDAPRGSGKPGSRGPAA